MKRVLLAGFVASLVMMVWGVVFWMALPDSMHQIKATPNEDTALAFLTQQLPASGVYILPYPPKELFDETFYEKHRTGPIAQIFYQIEGADPLNSKVMFAGWLHAFICALFMSMLVAMVHRALPSYRRRWGFVTLTGIFAAIAIEGLYPIWWHHAWGYHILLMIEQSISWAIAGLVIAGLVNNKRLKD